VDAMTVADSSAVAPARTATRHFPALALVLPGVCLALLAVPAELAVGVPGWVAASCGFVVIAAMCWLAFRRAGLRGENPWVDPTAVVSFFCAVFFGAGLLTLHFWDRLLAGAFPDLAPHFERYQSVLPALSRLTVLGCASLVLGTLLPVGALGRALPAAGWRFDAETFFSRSLLYLPVALLSVAATGLSSSPVPGPLVHVVKLMGDVSYVFLVLAAYCFAARRPRQWRWAALYLAYAVPLALRGVEIGMRGAIILPFAVGIFGYLLATGRMPWRYVAVVGVPFVLLLIPWATFVKQLRAERREVSRAVSLATYRLHETPARERLAIALWSTVRRFAAPGNFAPCVQRVPDDLPYQHGRVLLITLQSLPPRMLWPGKPNVSAELNRYSRLLGVIGPGDEKSSAVFNAFGLYYLDFGVAGLFVLCLGHGALVRVLRDWAVYRCNYHWGATLLLLMTLTKPDLHDLVVWGAGVVRFVVVSLPIVYVVTNRSFRLVRR